MPNDTTNQRPTLVARATRWRRQLQLGIVPRLAISFAAVAVLAVMANLIAEGKVSVLRTTAVRHIAPAPPPVVARPAPEPPPVAAPEPVKIPAPSPESMLRSIDRLGRAAEGSVDADAADVASEYEKRGQELERSASEFASAARQAGAPAPVRFPTTVSDFRKHGSELLALAARRRTAIAEYSTHLEQLHARAKQSLDQAWNIFGRVVARQSLVKLSGDLDELRRRYSELLVMESTDPSSFEKLEASETSALRTLVEGRAAFTRADGDAWYGKCRDDLEAMSSAREALLDIDRQKREEKRRFAEDSATLSQIVARTTSAAAKAIASTPRLMRPAGEATPSDLRKPVPTLQMPGPVAQVSEPALQFGKSLLQAPAAFSMAPQPALSATDTDGDGDADTTTTVTSPDNRAKKAMIAWISAAVLVLVVYISTGTALSIARPVRRLLSATARVAKGESGVRVEPGGVRELNTLAHAFNEMAEQLSIAQAAARDQQHLLEAKVTERTLQLQEMAQVDPLTRLANRRHFFALLNDSIRRAETDARQVGVFFIDIDNFKNMNDGLGHAFGDQVLVAMAERLERCAREFGFSARLGGDEFTVVYESASSTEEIFAAGQKLIGAFKLPINVAERELVVSISVGASVFPEDAADANGLLSAADAALFRAKALGRNQLALFTPALREAAAAKFATEHGLRLAIERGEFELAFQPEINLQTCETELVEALLRWRMPGGRWASPGEFLPVAEETGLIVPINEWVLKKAVAMAAHWHHGEWPAARVAINVSPRQLVDDGFVDHVLELLAAHNLPPRCIEIELTETVLQTGPATLQALERLRSHGIAIALDDFGTGYSSLASLEQLPLRRIKLDRSLVDGIDTNPRSATIAKAIITLCQGLGLQITAEGIERPEQLTGLLGYPDLYGQGFLLSRPVPADRLMAVMAGLPELTRGFIRAGVSQMPDSQLAEQLPILANAVRN